MSNLTIIQVTVRRRGDCYLARAGRGKTSKTASSTNSAFFAAQAAAEKFVGKKNILSIGPVNGTSQSAELFRVEVTHATAVVQQAAKPLRKTSVIPAEPARAPAQIAMAFAACRSIKFAADDAERRGTWDLNSLLAAKRLALVALGVVASLEDAS